MIDSPETDPDDEDARDIPTASECPADCDEQHPLDEFFSRYNTRIRRYIARQVPPEAVQGIESDTWVGVVTIYGKSAGTRNWHRFIWGIVRNKIKTYYRQRGVSTRLQLALFSKTIEEVVEMPDICDREEQARKLQAVEDGIMNEITELQRIAIDLRFGSEITYQEVADIMGISASCATKHVERGLARLRKHVAMSGFAIPAKSKEGK